MSNIDLVIVAIESPLLIGIYQKNILIEVISAEGQTSEVLPIAFQKIQSKFIIKRVLFANGPGSFMAIKINYVFLRTVASVLNIELFSRDAFFFNSNTPVKALNNMFFVKRDKKIYIERISDFINVDFSLPNKFEVDRYSKKIEPLYILPFL